MNDLEVIYQYRWYDSSEYSSTRGQWYPWETVNENKVREIEHYISIGLCYQIRELKEVSRTGYVP